MKPLADVLLQLDEYLCLKNFIKDKKGVSIVSGVSESQKAHLCYALSTHLDLSCIYVTYNEVQAQKAYEDFEWFYGLNVYLFPHREIIFYDVEAVSADILDKRLKVLGGIINEKKPFCLVLTIDALLSMTLPKEDFIKYSVLFEVGQEFDLQELTGTFTTAGYVREDMVEGRGQYSIRGGILDFYPHLGDTAFRIEFFDNIVDSIRELDTITQKSVGKVRLAQMTPASEIVMDGTRRQILYDKLVLLSKKLCKKENAKKNYETLAQDIEKIDERLYFPSLDKYLPMIYEGMPTISDYLGENVFYAFDEPLRISERVKTSDYMAQEQINSMVEKGILADFFEYLKPYHETIKSCMAKNLMGIGAISIRSPDFKAKMHFSIVAKGLTSFHGKMEFLLNDLEMYKNKKYAVVIAAGNRSRGEALRAALLERDILSSYKDEIDTVPQRGEVVITRAILSRGFEYPLINFVLITDREIFGTEKKHKVKKTHRTASSITSVADLSVNDFVVHQNYGIGQYMGISKLIVEGITKDYLKIRYAGDDFLYVPANQLDLVNKYIGNEDRKCKLNKMGGSDWTRTKEKVKSSCMDLAKGLIELYAARQEVEGHIFAKDNEWQRQFEDTFQYEETSDQLKCIEEVKEDMETNRPMDRLLCGDVGYGKTEVAIRAAFKCVMDGKQAAYLVPTTILAQQHYNNFKQRMKDYPVTVEMLSRFKSPKEQKVILKKLKTGEVDIVIGTHRILQKDLQFKDMGLLIIDEEQRFGVLHKERLKEIRKEVDVLTLTATPIPRTLHMAMAGLKDMSVIEEPPEDRYPVQTYVMEYNIDMIQDAILREIARGGQVYYLFNRVLGINALAARLQKMIPEANVAAAHGQMNENELEDIMVRVLGGEINVLVCTTIIETGIDIANVNTIIIEDSDKMGLAQLYQLRGRVGRSNRLAYAYLTFRRDKVISEQAEKRLKAIKEFTEFGSGFKIAMRDLEIRGAGNLLGSEQHGHMDTVGYDMYCRLLEVAVRELQGLPKNDMVQASIDLNISAFIPDTFIKNHDHRIEIYKKIAAIETEQDMFDVEEEIEDRYGDLPEAVGNLVLIAFVKHLAQETGICEVNQKGESIIFIFADEKRADIKKIIELIAKNKGRILLNAGTKPYLSYKLPDLIPKNILYNIKFLLQTYKEL